MICPHCNKPIEYAVDDRSKARAEQLVNEGYSLRETEKMLFKEGLQMSFSSISRMFRMKKLRDKKENTSEQVPKHSPPSTDN